MAYLVTGGTGFIGSYVVRDLLERGEKVVCLQRSGVTDAFREVLGEDNLARVKIVTGDLSNSLQLFKTIQENDIKVIAHLAFIMRPLVEQDPAYALQVNCVGMANILEAVRLFHLKKVVSVGAGAVFGRIGEWYKEPMKDTAPFYDLNTFYSATKALDEVMCRLYFDKFGVDNTVLRLAMVFGIGKWKSGMMAEFNEVLRKASLNIPATMKNADTLWGYVYVEDLSQLILQACDATPTKTCIFNVMDAELDLHEIKKIICKVNPEARITVEAGKSGIYVLPRMDTTAVRTELGWRPKYGIEEGIRRIMNYYRRQAGLPPFS